MSDELMRCPFCGGEASLCEVEAEIEGETFLAFVVACEECGVSTPASNETQKVIDCWNKRDTSERENELERLLVSLVNAHYDELNARSRHIRAILQAKDFLKSHAD